MILRRLGNKSKLATEIQKYFPPHKIYIEPFFGAGGMFFNKPKAKYNFLNDIDSDVFNLFNVVTKQKDELVELFLQMPVHEDLFAHWKTKEETDPVFKAVRFLFLSNFGYLGKPNTIRFGVENTSEIILKRIIETNKLLFGCSFTNVDFRDVFSKFSWKDDTERKETFIYCDPPYLNTTNNYSESFTQDDSSCLFDLLQNSGCNFAYSEFNHPFILEQAKKRNMNIIEIGERRSLNNRSTEIIVTNYVNHPKLF